MNLPLPLLKKKYPLQFGKNNPILRRVCDPITTFDHDTRELAYALTELLWEHDGVGIAAPQIGVALRAVSITEWKEKNSGAKRKLTNQRILINPIIVEKSEEMQVAEEGCLSLPQDFGNVSRYNKITIAYQDEKGQKQTLKATGFTSVIIQHEIDHLDGVLFIDKTKEA